MLTVVIEGVVATEEVIVASEGGCDIEGGGLDEGGDGAGGISEGGGSEDIVSVAGASGGVRVDGEECDGIACKLHTGSEGGLGVLFS